MKLDPKITQALQDWLNTPEELRDIKAGADLMLSLNRNRALYNSILRNPAKYTPKLLYELRKYLAMRIAGKAVADVVHMEQRIMPAVAKTLAVAPEISADDELPQAVIAKGRRADHDSLPAEVRELWESNFARYEQIRLLYNELKAMSDAQPCDRYEKLVILDGLDKKYRSNLAEYDAYVLRASVPMGGVTPAAETPAVVNADNANIINSARKTLSKYRKQLQNLAPDDGRRTVALEKIQNAVDSILACGAGVADDTKAELLSLGIRF